MGEAIVDGWSAIRKLAAHGVREGYYDSACAVTWHGVGQARVGTTGCWGCDVMSRPIHLTRREFMDVPKPDPFGRASLEHQLLRYEHEMAGFLDQGFGMTTSGPS